MNSKEAKDFLVTETAKQAEIQGIPLSDLEKRMMYFTETDECPEDPIALNDAFEAEYRTDEYEAKISKLMHHAYQRIRKESPEASRQWKAAMSELSKGDHYILVLCQDGAPTRPAALSVGFPVVATILVSLFAVLVVVFLRVYSGTSSGGGRGRYAAPSGVSTSMPLWLQRLLWFLIVSGYLYYVIVPWVLKKPLPGVMSVISKLFRRESRNNPRG